MKIYLNDQKDKFTTHLSFFKEQPVIPYNAHALKHKTTARKIKGCENIKLLNLTSFFDYNIFPSNILIPYTQWQDEGREMKANDTIIQQIYLPPTPSLSQKIIAAVRIKEVFKTDHSQGFSYETIKGHVEKGISTFKIEQIGNEVFFVIETYSTPNNPFLRFFRFFPLLYQDYCTGEALTNVTTQLQQHKAAIN